MSDHALQRFEIVCRVCHAGNAVSLTPALVKFPERVLVLQFLCRACGSRESLNLTARPPPP